MPLRYRKGGVYIGMRFGANQSERVFETIDEACADFDRNLMRTVRMDK